MSLDHNPVLPEHAVDTAQEPLFVPSLETRRLPLPSSLGVLTEHGRLPTHKHHIFRSFLVVR